MSPLAATARWRPPPCPSCTTVAVNPGGSVRPSLSAAMAVAETAKAKLTTLAKQVARICEILEVLMKCRACGAGMDLPAAGLASGRPLRERDSAGDRAAAQWKPGRRCHD